MTDCLICFDACAKPVCCSSCSSAFCAGCVEQFLTNTGLQVFCPESTCARPWSEDFVDAATSDQFRHGALRQHREKLLVDVEKARLAEYQEDARRYAIAFAEDEKLSAANTATLASVEEYITQEKVFKDAAAKASRAYWSNYSNKEKRAELEVEKDRWRVALSKFQEENFAAQLEAKRVMGKARRDNTAPWVRDVLRNYGAPIFHTSRASAEKGDALYGPGWVRAATAAGAGGGAAPREERVQILRGCPAEACRGFLSTGGICGICDAKICLSCHEIVGKKGEVVEHISEVELLVDGRHHTCDPASVETAKMLQKETRPCPTCKALIFKTDGCDQMWCTQCQTPFSWRTGKKEEGRVHNPHYYEWLRRTQGGVAPEPAQPGDVGFGGAEEGDCCRPEMELVDFQVNYAAMAAMTSDVALEKIEYAQAFIRTCYRKTAELMERGYRFRAPEDDHRYRIHNINVVYLAGKIDEKEWKRRIFIEKRAQQRRSTYVEIARTLMATCRDVLNSFLLGRGSIKALECIKQLVALYGFACEEIQKYKKRFNYNGIDNEGAFMPWSYDMNFGVFAERMSEMFPGPINMTLAQMKAFEDYICAV